MKNWGGDGKEDWKEENLKWYRRQKIKIMKMQTSIKRRWRIEGVRAKRIARRRAWNAEALTAEPVNILLNTLRCSTCKHNREIIILTNYSHVHVHWTLSMSNSIFWGFNCGTHQCTPDHIEMLVWRCKTCLCSFKTAVRSYYCHNSWRKHNNAQL